jgi:hypothetical protein
MEAAEFRIINCTLLWKKKTFDVQRQKKNVIDDIRLLFYLLFLWLTAVLKKNCTSAH